MATAAASTQQPPPPISTWFTPAPPTAPAKKPNTSSVLPNASAVVTTATINTSDIQIGSYVYPRSAPYPPEGPLVVPTSNDPNKFYQVLEVRGEGSHSVIYKVKHVATGTFHAMKVRKQGDSETYAHSVFEACTLKALNSDSFIPHIITYKDAFDINCHNPYAKKCAIFTEFVKDSSLSTNWVVPAKSLEITRTIARQMLEFLASIHSKGIHADFTSANVLLNLLSRTVNVTDLESFRPNGTDLKNGTVTQLWYRAPELIYRLQKHGKVLTDPSLDLWSAACIVFECITGKKFTVTNPGSEEAQFQEQLHMIAYRMEQLPSFELLSRSRDSEKFYKLDHQNKRVLGLQTNKPCYSPLSWKKHIGEVAHACKWNQDELKEAIDFLDSLFQYDPTKRKSALAMLNHPFLRKDLPVRVNIEIPPTTKLSHLVFRPYTPSPRLPEEGKGQMPTQLPSITKKPDPILSLPLITSKNCVHLPGNGDGSDVYKVDIIDKTGAVFESRIITASEFPKGYFLKA